MDESPGYREEFGDILFREGFGFLPCGVRAIADVRVKVVDRDADTLDRRGRPASSVSLRTGGDERVPPGRG